MPLYVGTSGWQYKDWRGRFYPRGLPARDWLAFYAASFATVEINASFYRLPERSTFTHWAARVPPDERLAVKASRYLTHIRRLREPEEPVSRLMRRAEALGARLGPVLLQLPPTLRADPVALDTTLACFPTGTRVAVEMRHPSWWEEKVSIEVRAVLAARGAALCWADRLGRPVTPLWRTAGWGYLRLHEGRAAPRPSYGRQALAHWVERLCDTFDDRADVFVYTNNDQGGAALRDAVRFAGLARGRGRTVTRTPRLDDVTIRPDASSKH